MKQYYSDLNVEEAKDLLLLKQVQSGLLNIEFKEDIDEQVEVQNLELEYKALNTYSKLSKEEAYIIACNLIKVVNQKKDYIDFDINFDNIYINDSLDVKVFIRKISREDIDYLQSVEAFAIALLRNQDYNTIYNSELRKYRSTLNVSNVNTLDELHTLLQTELVAYKTKQEKDYKKVNKRAYQKIRSRNIFKNIIVVALIISLLISYFYFYDFEKAKSAAYNAYIHEDYNGVVTHINKYADTSRLSDEEKVMLTRSIVLSSDLKPTQQELILKNLDQSVSDDVHIYWSSIAQQDYEEALTRADVLKDLDLEMYAAVKYLEYLEDADMSSSKRSEKIDEVSSKLDSYKDQKEQLQEQALQEQEATKQEQTPTNTLPGGE